MILGSASNFSATYAASNSKATVVKASAAPNIEVVSQGDHEILVADETTVYQLTSQIRAADGSNPSKLVETAAGAAKQASDALATGDILKVTAEDVSDTSEYKIVSVKKEGKDGYWDGPLYRQIENAVKENIPVFKNVDYAITDVKYAAYLREIKEEFYIAGSNSKSNPQFQTVTDYTEVFKQAIAEANANGGGRVVVPARKEPYYTGAIHLLSNVNLHVEEGATVKFVRTKKNEFYPLVKTRFEGVEAMNFSPFIYAFGQENIGITGKGTLDGQADAYNWIPWKTGSFGWLNQATLRATLFGWGDAGIPAEQRILDDSISTLRPCFIEPYLSKNVLIENLTIINSPMWEVHPALSENVMVRGLKINSKLANNDGVDPESSKNVIIENNVIDTGDDCIAIKSGRDGDGRRINIPSENIIVRNNVFKKGHGGVTMGSEMSGGIRNIFIEGNYFDSDELDYPLRFKTSALRGGVIENIYLRNSSVNKSRQSIIRAEMTYEDTSDTGPYTPVIRNIGITNFTTSMPPVGDNNIEAKKGIDIITVDRQPVENMFIKDSVFTGVALNASGVESIANVMSVGRVKNLVFDNVVINGRVFNLENVKVNDVTAGGSVLQEGITNDVDTSGDSVEVVGYIDTEKANFLNGADVHVTVDKTASKATDTKFETAVDGRIKFTASVPVPLGLHTVTVVAIANDKYNMDVKVFKVRKFKNGNDIVISLKKGSSANFVTDVDDANKLITASPGLTVENLGNNVVSANESALSFAVLDKNRKKKTTGTITSTDTLEVSPVSRPGVIISYKFNVYVEIRATSTTSNTLFNTVTRSTPTTDFSTWGGNSTSNVPVLGTVRYIDVITKSDPAANPVWFNLVGNVAVSGTYRAEILEKLPAGNGAKVELYINDAKLGGEIDTQLSEGTDYTVSTNTFRVISAGTVDVTSGEVNAKFIMKGPSAASTNANLNRIAVSYVRLYLMDRDGVRTELSGSDNVIAGAPFDVTYSLANVKAGILAQDLTFTYDPSKVEFVSAESIKDGFLVVDKKETPGKVRILAVNIGGNSGALSGGDLLRLRWNAKPLTGTSASAITLSNVVIANAEGEETVVAGTSHELTIAYVDKAALLALIAEAQQAHDGAVEGTHSGQYPAGSKADLLTAIHSAQIVADHTASTTQQVQKAAADLSAALQTFKDSVITGIPGDMNGDDKVSVGDLAIIAKYYGKSSADPDWNQYKSADLNNDGVIDIADLAIVARKILEF
ncbi:hypothetical protein GC097_02055 [Paenibacillus sp. LMG 31457]|uniref:Probable pectate lyase C n=2 Tax=Paenibacillus planticolens TaxID=2654976 RepID=A0ABX1ZIB8_9BACL|nr:hypothetical protein [Paenibacillus planticolens]